MLWVTLVVFWMLVEVADRTHPEDANHGALGSALLISPSEAGPQPIHQLFSWVKENLHFLSCVVRLILLELCAPIQILRREYRLS